MSNDRKKEIAEAIYELNNALGCIEFHTEKIKEALNSLKEISNKPEHEDTSSEEDFLIWEAKLIGRHYFRNTEDGEEDISVFYKLHDKHDDYLKAKKEAAKN